jgi:hypothetical protein
MISNDIKNRCVEAEKDIFIFYRELGKVKANIEKNM